MATRPSSPEPVASKEPTKKKRLLIGLIAGVLVLGGGGGAWYFLLGPGKAGAEPQHAEHKAPQKKAPVYVTLEPFTVNLQDEDGAHYLQVALVLSAVDAAAVDAVKVHMPMIRNGILLLLSSKRSEDLVSLDGKQKLAGEIVAEARKPLSATGTASEGIDGVYFSSFVIQ